MKFKIALFSLLFALICAPTNAQEWAQKAVDDSPRHLEWATIKAGDRKVQAFVAYPEVSEKATAIVLIHEIYGHSDWVRLMADHLAEAGYLVVAPDLLSGMAPDGDGTDGCLIMHCTKCGKLGAVPHLPQPQRFLGGYPFTSPAALG